MKKARIIFALALSSAVTLSAWLFWPSGQAKVDDFSDLRVELKTLPAEKNLRVLLEESINLLPAHVSTSDWRRVANQAWCGEWPEKKLVAALADSAVARSHFRSKLAQCEGYAGMGSDPLLNENNWPVALIFSKPICPAWNFEFYVALHDGNMQLCYTNVSEAIRLTELLLSESGDATGLPLLTFFMHGALMRCEKLLHRTDCPDEWLAEWSKRLPSDASLRTAGVLIMKGMCSAILDHIDDGRLYRHFLEVKGLISRIDKVELFLMRQGYSLCQTKRLIAESFREGVKLVQAEKMTKEDLRNKFGDVYGLKAVWKPNAGGTLIASYSDWAANDEIRSIKRLETSVACVQTVLACERFRRKYGAHPATLDALVPEFLKAVPRDTYGGGPLHYSRVREIVWSVGENLKDDDGSIKTESGKDGLYREARMRYALDMVYPISSSKYAEAQEVMRQRTDEKKR